MMNDAKKTEESLFAVVHLETTTHSSCLLLLLLLHLLGDFNVHFEVFADASIEADGFALVQVSFTIIGWNTLLDTAVGKAIDELVLFQEIGNVDNGDNQMQLTRNKGNRDIYIPGHHVCNHLDLQLGLSYLLFGRDLGTAAEQVRHFCRELMPVGNGKKSNGSNPR